MYVLCLVTQSCLTLCDPMDIKGENTLRGKELQLPILYQGRVLHYCCEKLPWSELGEGVMSVLRTRHQP